MLNAPTLLVLGAGSSADFGFPTGDGLAGQIKSALSPAAFRHTNFERQAMSDSQGLPLSSVLMNAHHANQRELQERAFALAAEVQSAGSIDTYLCNHADKPLVTTIGKAAIIDRILQAERKSGVYTRERQDSEIKAPDGSWLDYLSRLLQTDLAPGGEAELFRNLRVISFNYDRVLEHYFYNRLQRYWAMSPGQAARLMESLTILRPYGRVGPLPWQDDSSAVPFGGPTSLLQAYKNILTFNEQVEDDALTHFRAQMEWAENIVFLGFGFHRQNLRFLEFNGGGGRNRRIFATAMGISPPNQDIIQRRLISNADPARLSIHLVDTNSLGLLSHFSMALA